MRIVKIVANTSSTQHRKQRRPQYYPRVSLICLSGSWPREARGRAIRSGSSASLPLCCSSIEQQISCHAHQTERQKRRQFLSSPLVHSGKRKRQQNKRRADEKVHQVRHRIANANRVASRTPEPSIRAIQTKSSDNANRSRTDIQTSRAPAPKKLRAGSPHS